MEKEKNGYWSGLLSGLLLAVLLFGCTYVGRQIFGIYEAKQIANGKEQSELLSNYTTTKIEVIEDTIEKYYLSGTDLATLEDGLYSGMVDALGDPYSVYYSAQELEEIQQKTEGIYYGIGAYISKAAADEFCTISGVIKNTPAEAAGLRTGDIIYEVDGVLAQGMETTEIVSLIKGEEGTTVTLTLIREGESDYLHIPVERRKIESPTVEWEMLENNIGYILITEFDDVTTDQFAEALAECRGKGMTGLILDLRSNPGGNLSTVCEIARMLLPEGLIVYTEDKNGQREEYTSDGKREIDIPMVVLVNGYSASASEILAGAIQDYGVGTIMGTTTFGKGIVQRIISLSDGSAVKLTVSKYYTPNGNDIHQKGIVPDVEVEFDSAGYYADGKDNQLEDAIKYLGGELPAGETE
ncbi:MAG: S41 family peptidase [Lachnospiraceae bacterium]|nr:S41 family peptidase [Lachnospiraceae bacterium]